MKLTIPGFSVEINEKDYEALEKVANSDLIGLIGGDWLKYWRWNNLLKIANKFRLKCEAEGFTPKGLHLNFCPNFLKLHLRRMMKCYKNYGPTYCILKVKTAEVFL